MGLLKDFMSHASGDAARILDRYSRDPRLSDERRSQFQDKAALWRDFHDRIDSHDD